MSGRYAPDAIRPEAYAIWRATTLGIATEAIEQGLILELMGELAWAQVLDAGCGDGALVSAAAVRGVKTVLGAPHEVINLFGPAIRNCPMAEDLKATMFEYPTGASDIGYML